MNARCSDNHYRKLIVYRVPYTLPCAINRTHGKQPICRVLKDKHNRVPGIRYTAKIKHVRTMVDGR